MLVPVIGAACVVAGSGVGLWVYDAKQRKKRTMELHLQTLLEQRAQVDREGGLTPAEIAAATAAVGLHWGPAWLRHPATLRVLGWIVAVASLLALPLVVLSFWEVGLLLWSGLVAAGALWAWRRWRRQRQQVLLQLPSFIDAMVRMVILGHASQSAFLQAAATTKAPLADTLGQAVAFAKAGMPVEEALSKASLHWGLSDFSLLASVLQLGARYGGRLDALLERIAGFMRDREAATQELHALSTEVRLSAWILGLLPIAVGGAIVVGNVNYFVQTWADPGGQKMLIAAAVLQLTGVVLLYRVARLD